MNLYVRILKNRRAFIHLTLCLLYVLLLLVLNSHGKPLTMSRVVALSVFACAGIAMAYWVRYCIILWRRKARGVSAIMRILLSFFLLGLLGYLLLHGMDTFLSRNIVNPNAKVLWSIYWINYGIWYLNFAKYGILFFVLDKELYGLLDTMLVRYFPDSVIPLELQVTKEVAKTELVINAMMRHFSQNFRTRISLSLLTVEKFTPVQVDYMQDLLSYGEKHFYFSPSRIIPLRKEIDITRKFLAIEDCTGIRFEVSGDVNEAYILPSLILSVAKNMVKHSAVSADEQCTLLTLRVEEQQLMISSRNLVADNRESSYKSSGQGLEYMRKQLAETYGDKMKFEVEQHGGIFKLLIQLPVKL
ncbi:hypothetical protein [Sphingobacterium sp. LRF_L2]|uniref:hypothetical protein n=1 Tax=Sphingobacterium sp. LRF_L2 TaxID=3369421 RepID=UPI003F643174